MPWLKITKEIKDHIHLRLQQAAQWVADQAPSHLKIVIPEEVPKNLLNEIDTDTKKIVNDLIKTLESISWTEEEIRTSMMELKTKFKLSRKKMTNFFGALYLIILGTNRGPRFAPFIAALEKEWVIKRLSEINN